MQSVVGRNEERRRSSAASASAATMKEFGGVAISMYSDPPTEDISLEDFESFALDRLAVLKGTEEAVSRGIFGDDLEKVISTLLSKHELQIADPVSGKPNAEAMHKDMISHFILRLVYCKTEDLRRWFLAQECALFKHRFARLAPAARMKFLADNNLHYTPVAPEEFAAIKDKLYDTALAQREKPEKARETLHAGFYAVPFEEVFELVSRRKVFLRRGFAYVPVEQLSVLVVGAYRAALSKAAALTARRWASGGMAEEAERLAPIVDALSTQYLGSDYSAGGDGGGAGFALADLAQAADQSMPLCMRNLHAHLKEDHHLRHAGRMQLGLFLKGIGLSLEDALLFWRTEFCKKIMPEAFDKQYAYNVRHNYGREGKRQDYTPHSCMKICASTPGTGEHHGCPYRTFGEDSLRAALRSMKIAPAAMDDIMDKAKKSHYQLACGQTWQARHGKELPEGVQHPNQYFRESRIALGHIKPAGEAAGTGDSPITPGAKPTGGPSSAAPMTH